MRRFSRVRRYHFREGASRRSAFVMPGFLAGLLIFAAIGISRVDFGDLMAKQPQNNVANTVDKELEVSALEQSIIRANELESQDESLADAINKQLDNYPIDQEWSVYVNDLSSGLSASINADKMYDAGGLYKLFLLAPLETKISAAEWDSYWAGGYNVSYCLGLALGAADDDCAEQLGGYVNWDYSDEHNNKTGFLKTDLGAGSKPVTNARETGQLLTQLKTSRLLSDFGRRQVFDSLYHQDYIAGLPATCKDCAIANKSTSSGEFVHDAGIVTRGQKSYVVVIMSEGGSLNQIGQIARVVDKVLSP
jgi:beta-lactamase family protein